MFVHERQRRTVISPGEKATEVRIYSLQDYVCVFVHEHQMGRSVDSPREGVGREGVGRGGRGGGSGGRGGERSSANSSLRV